MHRRHFAAAPLALVLPLPSPAADGHRVDYSPAAYQQALSSGKPVLLDFYAPW